MTTMSKTTFLSGVFLFATMLVAFDAAAAGPCPHYRDPNSCNYDSRCFWDQDDQRCEANFDPSGYCGGLDSPYQCNHTQGCFWDTDDQRCETQ